MSAHVYWVKGPWPGKLGLAARPRGGDWLARDLADWRSADISSVVSLLTPEENQELGLGEEGSGTKEQGMTFRRFPIPDLAVPASEAKLVRLLEDVDHDLSNGRNVLIHCRQGIGRTGLVAISLLVTKGMSPGAAVDVVSAARGLPVPETDEQRRWIDRFAATLAGTK